MSFLSPQAPRIWRIGAGHVAKPSAALARNVGFDVTVVDDREDYNCKERFAGCGLEVEDPSHFLQRTALGVADWVLIVTHDMLALNGSRLARSLAQVVR